MNIYIKIIEKNWQTLVLIVLALVFLSLVFSLFRPLEYRSRVELLIIQKQSFSMDAYAAARASEKLANNLSAVIETRSFLDKVIEISPKTDWSDFAVSEKKLRKMWQKKVDGTVSTQASILTVDVFDVDKERANLIAGAVAQVLTTNANEYHGGGSDVSIKIVNQPLASDYPVRPNILANGFSAIVLGLLFGLVFVFYKNKEQIDWQRVAFGEEDNKLLNQQDELSRKINSLYGRALMN